METQITKAGENNAIALITLKRPPANAMSLELTEQVAETFYGLAKDPEIKAVILTGDGKAFCAGLDLKSVPGFTDDNQRRLLDALNNAFYSVYSFPKPVIGAINGHAIAGGLVLALCTDYRIAAQKPFHVGVTEVRVGIPYPVAAIEVTREELDTHTGRNLVLFGQNISQAQATEKGIFDEAVPEEMLLRHALQKAEEFSKIPSVGFEKIKRQLRRTPIERIELALKGQEPLYGDWLSEETLAAAHAVLKGK